MLKSQRASRLELSGQLAACGLRRDIYVWSLDTGSAETFFRETKKQNNTKFPDNVRQE
jgi:hypothetical protein